MLLENDGNRRNEQERSDLINIERRRKCIVCSRVELGPKKRTDTLYEYVDCDVGLCVDECFKKYHT